MCEAAVEGGCLAAPGWPELWRNCSSPAVELLRRGEIPDTEDQCKRQITKALDDLLDLTEPSTEFREVQVGALKLIEGQVDGWPSGFLGNRSPLQDAVRLPQA